MDIIYFKDNDKNPRKIILNKIPDTPLNVLEIAVGTAKNIILLAKNKKNLNITGIDMSEDMLKLARKSINKHNTENITLLNMNAADMTFGKEEFDIIIISLLLHEVENDLRKKILDGCKRVMKKDGKIFLLEWNEPKRFFQKLMFSTIKIFEPKEFKIFMKLDLFEYFKSLGFCVNNIEYGDYTQVLEIWNIRI